MNREELLKLREQIVANARQLALESDIPPSDKLEVLMDLMRSGDMSQEVVVRAYEAAKQLPQESDKLGAFLDIIYQIDAEIAADEAEDDQTTSEESSNSGQTSQG